MTRRAARTRAVMETLESRVLLSAAVMLFQDQFSHNGPVTQWTADTSFLGRTQLSPILAAAKGGMVKLTIDTYNPTGFAFAGTGLVSHATFTPQAGTTLIVTLRAKLDAPIAGGLVGGLFLYPEQPDAAHNNEFDFELTSNQVASSANLVETNSYANDPLGAGHPLAVTLPAGGTLAGWHTYQMRLDPGVSATWLVDGKGVRTETTFIPSGPMQLRMNLWSPTVDWAWAFDGNTNPVSDAAHNTRWSMSVDYATVQTVKNAVGITGAAASVDSASVMQLSPVTGSATIDATGYGNISYCWMVQGPNGKTVRATPLRPLAINNAAVNIPDVTLPTTDFGDYHAWVRVFKAGTVVDSNVVTYTAQEIPATIAITHVPPPHLWGVTLTGAITGPNSARYKVAVLINVNGGWWTKPYWNRPGTTITPAGRWSCVVATGGMDGQAQEFRAYLVPKDFVIPLASGGGVPTELEPFEYADAVR